MCFPCIFEEFERCKREYLGELARYSMVHCIDSSLLSKISKVDFDRIEEMIAPTIADIVEVRRSGNKV